jgi:hypothetical protein
MKIAILGAGNAGCAVAADLPIQKCGPVLRAAVLIVNGFKIHWR